MAIIGLGTDIVEIARIGVVLERSGNKFAKRILTENEFKSYQMHSQPINYLAKRFSVKEAAVKALGTGIRNGLSFQHFEVVNNEFGKPSLHVMGEAKVLAELLGVAHWHVSISDERHYACATVIVES